MGGESNEKREEGCRPATNKGRNVRFTKLEKPNESQSLK